MGKSIEQIMVEFDSKMNDEFGEGKWHCDDLWASKTLPNCVQKYLDIARAPAIDQIGKEIPKLFATYNGKSVRVVMASRMGDVGITTNLKAERGYEERVYIPQLSNFSDKI